MINRTTWDNLGEFDLKELHHGLHIILLWQAAFSDLKPKS